MNELIEILRKIKLKDNEIERHNEYIRELHKARRSHLNEILKILELNNEYPDEYTIHKAYEAIAEYLINKPT